MFHTIVEDARPSFTIGMDRTKRNVKSEFQVTLNFKIGIMLHFIIIMEKLFPDEMN